ncbi:uncharacterized protein SAPINGB_P003774 [Magnusiomyces paraingens]|uniref:very-long-chain enoyl-CoA reductase n=1 Tax=Magnusiomyces paraingens TaxID=2606893 RepID=A0A5E8BYI3_9ASCO|nr:uncharacterized protein SAPINGB_P003774 [Saprochaete ingens]VVT53835.1 unnamed protein product [Saprochaete ingens]
MSEIAIKTKRGKISNCPTSFNGPLTEPVQTVIKSISDKTGLSVHRIRLTIPTASDDKPQEPNQKKRDTVLDPALPLSTYFSATSTNSPIIYVKDLGPQIQWRTVFFIEYFGPLLIHPIFYFGQKAIYGSTFEHSRVQQLAFIFTMLHFIKREFETAFVHHFSLDTMPVFNVFKNSSHYWFLSGINLAYFIYAPESYVAPEKSIISRFLFGRNIVPLGATTLYVLSALWLFAELSNGWTHLILSSLRSDGSKTRKIPYGYGFNLVSVPNYFFESLGWFAILLITQNWTSLLFFTVSTTQMWFWGVKKHRRYRKEFGDKYPKNRKIYVPFVI